MLIKNNAQEALAVAQEIMRNRQVNFPDAWNAAREQRPDLFKALDVTVQPINQILEEGRLKNRAKSAARFNKEVQQFQREKRCKFEDAWTQVRNRNPALFKEMAGE